MAASIGRSLSRLQAGVIASGAGLMLAAVGAAAPASANALLTHRAVYDLSLAETSQATGVSAVQGRMVYELTGGACEGYAVAIRFVIRVADQSGVARVTDLQTTSFEDAAGDNFQFLSKTFVDQKLTEETRGRAERVDAGDIAVSLQKPTEEEASLPGDVLFPTQHVQSILKAAEAGETIVIADVFDGSETGNKIYETTTVLGGRRDTVESVGEDNAEAVAEIGSAAHWPVTIAYFDPTSDQEGESTPAYQIGFLLYDNGVSRRLLFDYGDFEVGGALRELTRISPVPCPE